MKRRKQPQNCTHDPRHVVPAVDPRYERCQLCGMVRPAPVLAPWIAAHDEALPPLEPPPLFAALIAE